MHTQFNFKCRDINNVYVSLMNEWIWMRKWICYLCQYKQPTVLICSASIHKWYTMNERLHEWKDEETAQWEGAWMNERHVSLRLLWDEPRQQHVNVQTHVHILVFQFILCHLSCLCVLCLTLILYIYKKISPIITTEDLLQVSKNIQSWFIRNLSDQIASRTRMVFPVCMF